MVCHVVLTIDTGLVAGFLISSQSMSVFSSAIFSISLCGFQCSSPFVENLDMFLHVFVISSACKITAELTDWKTRV